MSAPTHEEETTLAPPTNYGMTVLDKDKFNVTIPCVAASVPANIVGGLKKDERMRKQFLHLPKTNAIVPDPENPARRRVLLSAASIEEVSPAAREYLNEVGAALSLHEVTLGWHHWSANEIMHAILPPMEDEIPSSFTQTGHIAHMNLREEWAPFKHIIGEVIVEKLPSVKTVVNKLNSIHNEFRFFDMEVLAGAPEFVTTTSESGCTFTFDFSKVYWNSRLHTEHARVVHQFEPGTVVADAMAGVGPFAVPAAKRGAYVLANDLNPESTKWMAENEKKNKVSERMRVTNIDAREFIRTAPLEAWTRPFKRSEPKTNKQKDAERKARLQAEQAGGVGVSASASGTAEQKQKEKPGPPAPQTISHYIMNLPDSALEFLDAYPGAFTPLLSQPGYDRNTPLPLVHVHCFTRFLEPETARDDINARASQRLGYTLTHAEDGYYLHPVRRVAPNKDMYCLTFRLPAEVAYRVL